MKKLTSIYLILFCWIHIISCTAKNKKEEKTIFYNNFELFKNTPNEELSKAVEEQDEKRIEFLICTKNIDVNYQEKKFGNTLLMLAVLNNLNRSIKVLMKNEANPNLRNFASGESAFIMACGRNSYQCNPTIVKLMIKNGANVNDLQEKDTIYKGVKNNIQITPLIRASEENCLETVKVLVSNGAKINQYIYYEGYNAISSSIVQDNLEIAKFLLIDCKSEIPRYSYKRIKNNKEEYITLYQLLNEKTYPIKSDNYILRKEMLAYLKIHLKDERLFH